MPGNKPQFDCLCAGIIVADFVSHPVARLPAPGELVLTNRIQPAIGGCASNVAVDLARLNRRVRIAGCVGADMIGDFVVDRLRAAAVNCDWLGRIESQQTSSTFVINVEGDDRRFISAMGANVAFDGSSIDAEHLRNSRMLYVGGYGLCREFPAESLCRLLQNARACGVTTLVDVVVPETDRWDLNLVEVLPLVDVFLPNDHEAELLLAVSDPVAQAARFHALGAKTVVITCGEHGAVLFDDSRQIRMSAHQANVVDGTGSGDAFAAGFIHGLLRGADAVDCLRLGSAMGASCVRTRGATDGVFDARQLDDFVAANVLPVAEC